MNKQKVVVFRTKTEIKKIDQIEPKLNITPKIVIYSADIEATSKKEIIFQRRII